MDNARDKAGKPADEHITAQHKPERQAALDNTIEDSFPASDPPSTVPDPDDREALGKSKKPAAPDRS